MVNKLVVEVVSARGLMPRHRQGSASACVGLNFDGQWFCTAVKEKDGNPVWNERFYFNISDPSNLPKLVLQVYVHHVNNSSQAGARSFIGRVRIYGSAIPPHSSDVALQYYQLEKRSLLQRINGELGLKVYMIPAMLLQQDRSPRPHDMPLQHLKEITNNFSNERILGQGGFGVVYKGILQNGETIAVKKITSSLLPGLQRQFECEVSHLMMVKHPNIVRCVGYCYETRNACLEYNGKYVFAETTERLLCLEYMPKGSLDKYISDESSGLDWRTRYTIIEGICYGLSHLHEENDKPIIHMDLKPPNILLGDGMLPKITDFGLSRLLDQQQTIYTSSRNGTLGYMAPEFLHGGTITPKSDIFSLGVVIMEVVTGHRDYPDVTRTPSNYFIELTIRKWRNVLQRSPGYVSLETDCEQIKRCIQVGLICVNPDRTKRPPIMKVIGMLQGSEVIDCDIANEALGKWKIRLVRSQSKRPPVRNIINMLRGPENIDCDIGNHVTSSAGKCGEPLDHPL